MKKFDYLTAYDPNIKELNEFGKAGWELISVVRYECFNDRKGYEQSYREFYFKREIVEGKEDASP